MQSPPPTSASEAPAIHAEEILVKGGAPYSSERADQDISTLLGERIKCGQSIVTLDNLITKEEINVIVRSSLCTAASRIINGKHSGSTNCLFLNKRKVRVNPYTRMSTVAAAQRQNRTDGLSEPTSLLLEKIFERALLFVDQHLCPSLKTTLFGDDEVSLVTLFQTNQLEFSMEEPAINVYTAPHGHFKMHKDGNDLTILIPLSDPITEFTGGGTAFWSQLEPTKLDDPSLILTPRPGTAMLFGGGLSHKGMHIQSGNRVVFVASFSRMPGPQQPPSRRE